MVQLCMVPPDWQNPISVWKSADGRYRLSELVQDQHLFHEAIYLRHDLALCPLEPEKMQWGGANSYLLHAIKTGQKRVFSFERAEFGQPLATIILDVSSPEPALEHIWGLCGKPIPVDADCKSRCSEPSSPSNESWAET